MKNKIKLSCGDWSAQIDPLRGANCVSLKNKRFEANLLREPPGSGLLDNPYLYGMPLLFPVNRIEGGQFEFEGRNYIFPINEPQTICHLHGQLHQTPFEIVEQSKSAVTCRFAAKEGEYLGFPHAFEILQRYELKENGLFHSVTVINQSDQNMPLLLGFHTTFNTLFFKDSDPKNIRVQAELSEEYARNMERDYLPTGEKPAFDSVSHSLVEGNCNPFAEKFSRHYRGSGKMTLSDLGNRLRVVYENDEKYYFRLIYNGGEAGYICLEPQTCLANCPNSPFSREEAGFAYLKADERKIFWSKIYLEEF